MSIYHYTVDTPHGRFVTHDRHSYFAVIFKCRNNGAKPDVLWLTSEHVAKREAVSMSRLGFEVLGTYTAIERVL
ncbi:hypothetical protein CWB96_00340 [Pseudoalteromonas citrea]|uniref:Uncharacterized protein n=1 Tax=Pseudoalteromonas citrea TaxID=43655 RepID=A0A5S3XXD1_9GAMM|nr:hypothetical protein [Pseudoalteromonas citrea]TMP46315.1 hypothetical protein CWB97_02335 [Pseudoalteromonas citrea]TMP63091.1 hypothetical protein CWB96_00340 [Pseudoalteromonas citrea]